MSANRKKKLKPQPSANPLGVGRSCEALDPGRFEKGVQAALTCFHAAHFAGGPVDFEEKLNPITIQGLGTLRFNESIPENRMMIGFMDGYGQAKTMSEKTSGLSRMLALFFVLQDSLRAGNPPKDLFEVKETGEVEGVSPDLFRAAALAPITMGGKFDLDVLFRIARLGGDGPIQ